MNVRKLFRFTVRQMLVAVTVLCAFVGWWVNTQLNWIANRRAALRTSGIQGNPDADHTIYDKPYAPNWLWIFGEKGQIRIVVSGHEISNDRIGELRRLFPEASLMVLADEGPLINYAPLAGFQDDVSPKSK